MGGLSGMGDEWMLLGWMDGWWMGWDGKMDRKWIRWDLFVRWAKKWDG